MLKAAQCFMLVVGLAAVMLIQAPAAEACPWWHPGCGDGELPIGP